MISTSWGFVIILFFWKIGRDDWIRTSDPFVPNEVRYQAALHPDTQKTKPGKNQKLKTKA